MYNKCANQYAILLPVCMKSACTINVWKAIALQGTQCLYNHMLSCVVLFNTLPRADSDPNSDQGTSSCR